MRLKQKLLIAILGAGLSLAGAGVASAATLHDTHPRRVEVNHRLEHQLARINRLLREGKISRYQAMRLRHEDRMIAWRERRDARLHHGDITAREQARLNKQESGIAGQIYRETH